MGLSAVSQRAAWLVLAGLSVVLAGFARRADRHELRTLAVRAERSPQGRARR